MSRNIWILVSRRYESSSSRNLPIMNWVALAMILLISTCLADEKASCKKADILKEAEENIRWLRQAKQQVERQERERNSLATLTDLMIKDSFDSQLMSKMDILYDNQTDLSKELKFNPQVFNCGKEFDIFKVLELAKAHRNITTEQPPCISDTDDTMCSTKKGGGEKSNNKMTSQGPKEAPPGLHAAAVQAIMSTKVPLALPAFERKTEPPASKISTPNAHKAAKIKPQIKEKASTAGRLVKAAQNNILKPNSPKGISSRPFVGHGRFIEESSLDDVQVRENPHISEDQQQRWYAAQVELNEPQQYPSIENQNENEIQAKFQEAQFSRPEAPIESAQQQVKGAQLPVVQTVSQQTRSVGRPSSNQDVEQSQAQNAGPSEMAFQKQQGLELTPSVQRDQALGITQGQQQSQQFIKLFKNIQAQKSLSQQQLSEQQKYYDLQLQSSEKRKQQQIQPSEKQNLQQPQPLEKQDQQQPQTAEQQKQQQVVSAEQLKQQQIQTAEQKNQQTAEQQKQQQVQTAEQQKQQQVQTAVQQNQQQVQTAEQQKLQQVQTAEQQKQQVQTAEQQKQLQIQTSEQQKQQQVLTSEQQKQQQVLTAEQQKQLQLQTFERHNQPPAVTDSGHQLLAAIPGPGQQQTLQKINSASDQQQVFKQQTLLPLIIEQNPLAAKPVANPIRNTAQQVAQLSVSQPVAKSSSEVPSKGLQGSSDKLINSNADKTILSAPVNVMVMEPNQNPSFGNPTSKVKLIHASIPATAYFWSNTMTHTDMVQNLAYDLKTEQNKLANELESSDIPSNIQENPKEDYIYYQDQD